MSTNTSIAPRLGQRSNVAGAINPNTARIPLVITSVIVDRDAGASVVDKVWGKELNVDWVAAYVRSKPEVRDLAATFLISNKSELLWKAIYGDSKTCQPGIATTVPEVLKILTGLAGNESAPILTELFIPTLIENGLCSTHAEFAIRRKLPYGQVTMEDILADLVAQDVSKILKEARARFKMPSGRHSVAAMGEIFSDAYVAVGRALANISDYEGILRDLCTGVRGAIDPSPIVTGLGSVPEYISRSAEVDQLKGCWNFVVEALQQRQEIAKQVGPERVIQYSEFWKFQKYAPVVVAMLKSSQRYHMISKNEYVATIGTKRIIDLKGKPVSVVVYDNATLEATAMAVLQIEDGYIPGTTNLSELPDRVGERVTSAYGRVPEVCTVKRAALALADQLQTAVEMEDGMEIHPLYNARLAETKRELDLLTAAVMMSDRLSARLDDVGENGEFGKSEATAINSYGIVLNGTTDVRDFVMKSGGLLGGEFFTADPVEFFLLHADVEPAAVVKIPAQLIPREAMRARVFGYDTNDFIKTTSRLGYKLSVLGLDLTGVIRLKELTTVRLSDQTSLVCPFHNKVVNELLEQIAVESYIVASRIKDKTMKRRALRSLGAYLLEQAQAVAPGFRAEIHASIIEKAVESLPYNESVLLRSKLRQQAVSAYADVTGANIFYALQGMSEKGSALSTICADPQVYEYWLEVGSDR